MLEAIARARSHRTVVPVGMTHTGGATTGSSTGTTLDIVDKTGDTSDWEKRAIHTVNALFGQCYDLGRAEDPAFAGTIMVRFTLVGEPGVGGVLENVEIVDKDTTITQPTFRDCITQQLYASARPAAGRGDRQAPDPHQPVTGAPATALSRDHAPSGPTALAATRPRSRARVRRCLRYRSRRDSG